MREALVKDRTSTTNRIHGFLLEFGISLPKGPTVIKRLRAHFNYLDKQIVELERELTQQLAEDDTSSRLLGIPGVGPITASVLATELGDARQFSNARQFAASVGLVPRQYSTGGKPTLLGISKRGDKNLRRLPVQCAESNRVLRRLQFLRKWIHEQEPQVFP